MRETKPSPLRSTTSRRKVPLSSGPSVQSGVPGYGRPWFLRKPGGPHGPASFGAPCCQSARMPPQLDRQRPCVAAAIQRCHCCGSAQTGTARSLVLPEPRGKGFLPEIQPDSSPVWWAGSRHRGQAMPQQTPLPPPVSSTAATAAVMRLGCFGRFGTGDQAKPGWRWSSRESSSIPRIGVSTSEPGSGWLGGTWRH